jgi:hypothetical protein
MRLSLMLAVSIRNNCVAVTTLAHAYRRSYAEMAAALGRGADAAASKPLPGDYTNITYAHAFFRLVSARLEADGIDAW